MSKRINELLDKIWNSDFVERFKEPRKDGAVGLIGGVPVFVVKSEKEEPTHEDLDDLDEDGDDEELF